MHSQLNLPCTFSQRKVCQLSENQSNKFLFCVFLSFAVSVVLCGTNALETWNENGFRYGIEVMEMEFDSKWDSSLSPLSLSFPSAIIINQLVALPPRVSLPQEATNPLRQEKQENNIKRDDCEVVVVVAVFQRLFLFLPCDPVATSINEQGRQG